MEEKENICLNCNNVFPKDAKYCSFCSQKTRSGKVTVREFLAEFFNEVFSLNSKLFKTLGSLFIPGKLTKEYFLGKRKSYAPPIRLFLVMLIIFFGVENYIGSSSLDSNIMRFGTKKKVQEDMIERLDDLSQAIKKEYRNRDSSLIDTLNIWFKNMPDQKMTYSFPQYNFDEKKIKQVKVLAEDIANLSNSELDKKYKFEGRVNTFLSKQMKKFVLDPSSLSQFIVGSMTWMILLLLPAMAGFLKLFYKKQAKYFVEHLVFLFHVHSFSLFVAIFIWLGMEWDSMTLIVILLLVIMIYWLFSLKNVYQESWGKTLIKSIGIFITYTLAFSFFMAIFTSLSFLLF